MDSEMGSQTMATKTIEQVAPQRIKMSYQEYLDFADEIHIAEWVEGEVLVYMPPVEIHQNIIRFLSFLLDSFAEFFNLGALLFAPFEVKLWPDGPSREPDIFFVTREKIHKLTTKRFEGAPDLIIEIISPSSVSEDRVRKFREYEQAGVKEYWIIDPRQYQQQVDFYVLGDDQQLHAAPLTDEGHFHSTVLPNFWFDINWLWRDLLPNPQMLLAQIMVSIDTLPANAKTTYQALYDLLNQRTSD